MSVECSALMPASVSSRRKAICWCGTPAVDLPIDDGRRHTDMAHRRQVGHLEEAAHNAAERPTRADHPRDFMRRIDAVLQREETRVLSRERAEGLRRFCDLPRLYTQEHIINRIDFVKRLNRSYLWYTGRLVAMHQRDPLLRKARSRSPRAIKVTSCPASSSRAPK